MKAIARILSRRDFSFAHIFFSGAVFAAIQADNYIHAAIIVIVGGAICKGMEKYSGNN